MRSADTEHRLDKLMIRNTYEREVPLAAFVSQTKRFQNRIDDVDEQTVEEYAISMKAGDDFPPILSIKRPEGYVVLDGHQRLKAAQQSEYASFDTYVLELQDAEAEAFALTVNTQHGIRLPHAARLNYALRQLDASAGQHVAKIASQYGLSESGLREAYDARKFDRRSEDLALPPTLRTLPKRARKTLQGIQLDRVFAEAARLAKDATLSNQEISQLVEKVQDAQSEKAAVEIVQAERESRKTSSERQKGRPKKDRSTIQTIEELMTSLQRFNPVHVAMEMTGDDRNHFQTTIVPRTSDWIDELMNAMKKAHAA